jgi:hypothetical protein
MIPSYLTLTNVTIFIDDTNREVVMLKKYDENRYNYIIVIILLIFISI